MYPGKSTEKRNPHIQKKKKNLKRHISTEYSPAFAHVEA